MENEIKIFNNIEFGTVRTVIVDNEPYFVGKDVAEILGYKETAKTIREKVDEEDKGVSKMDTPGGVQNVVIINESGLYSLILSSKLPKAKQFKHWVTSEVLPSIRKHGVYAIDEVLQNPDMLISALKELKAERERNANLETTIAVQNQQISELKPKASYYDVVLNCTDLISTTIIAKDFGKSANWLNKFLCEHGVQFKQGKVWLLKQKYADKGYTNTKTQAVMGKDGEIHTSIHTYWTQQGRLFIYHFLKEYNILPTVEIGE